MGPKRFFEDGQMCGPYEIAGIIGWGGYGQVYRALDDRGEHVALKVIRIHHARDRRAAQRFFKEAKTLRAIRHINVVGFKDWGIEGDDAYVYLAMELVVGKPLRQLMSVRGYFTFDRIASIGQQLCGALGAVHDLGLVHRDTKPENVIITTNGVVKLLDFGVVRDEVGIGTTHTVGTPRYLSPSQLRHPDQPLPAWDLWAASMILYELVTGKYPFIQPGEENPSVMALVLRINEWPIPPVEEVVPGCPPALSRAIMKGLERDPAEAWPSAHEYEKALEDVLASLQPADDPKLVARMEAIQRRSFTEEELAAEAAGANTPRPEGAAAPALGEQDTEPAAAEPPAVKGPRGTDIMQRTPEEAIAFARARNERPAGDADSGAGGFSAGKLSLALRALVDGDGSALAELLERREVAQLCAFVLGAEQAELAEWGVPPAAYAEVLARAEALGHGLVQAMREGTAFDAASSVRRAAAGDTGSTAPKYAAGADTDVLDFDLEAFLAQQGSTGPLPAAGGTPGAGGSAEPPGAKSRHAHPRLPAPHPDLVTMSPDSPARGSLRAGGKRPILYGVVIALSIAVIVISLVSLAVARLG